MCTKISSGGTGIDDEVMIQQSTILHYFALFSPILAYSGISRKSPNFIRTKDRHRITYVLVS